MIFRISSIDRKRVSARKDDASFELNTTRITEQIVRRKSQLKYWTCLSYHIFISCIMINNPIWLCDELERIVVNINFIHYHACSTLSAYLGVILMKPLLIHGTFIHNISIRNTFTGYQLVFEYKPNKCFESVFSNEIY